MKEYLNKAVIAAVIANEFSIENYIKSVDEMLGHVGSKAFTFNNDDTIMVIDSGSGFVFIDDDYDIQLSKRGYTYFKGNNTLRVCNFVVAVESNDTVVNANGEVHYELSLIIRKLSKDSEVIKLTLPVSKLGDRRWITSILDGTHICNSYPQLHKIISKFAEFAPKSSVFNCNGWNNGRYISGSSIIGESSENERCGNDCGWSFYCDTVTPELDPTDIIAEETTVLNAINSCSADEAAMMVYLNIVLSYMKAVLERHCKSRQPQFLTIILGPSMTGKTTLFKALLSHYSDVDLFDLSVGVTTPALFVNIQRYSDTIIPLDDFKVTGFNDTVLHRTFEVFTRLCGNADSSRKTALGSAELKGMGIMTAEYIPFLSESSINRMMVHKFTPGSISFDAINTLNQHRLAYSRHMKNIIAWIAERDVDKVAISLISSFENMTRRLADHTGLKSNRAVDAYGWLLATHEAIVSRYCEEKGIMPPISTEALFNYSLKGLDEAEHRRKELDCVYRFCSVVQNAYDSKSFDLQFYDKKTPLAKGKDGYETPSEHTIGLTAEAYNHIKHTVFRGAKLDTGFDDHLVDQGILIKEGKGGRGLRYRYTVGPNGEKAGYFKINMDEVNRIVG